MQLHPQINAWLNEPADYAAGLALLEAAGIRGILLRTLALGDDAYNRQRLETELRKWIKFNTDQSQNTVFTIDELRAYVERQTNVLPIRPVLGVVSEQSSVRAGSAPSSTVVSEILESDVPVEAEMSEILESASVNDLKEQAYDLMNERAELKARLRAFANDSNQQANRRDWAFRILAINEEIDELYSRIDFFDEYGYLPPSEEPAAEVDDTTALMNARTYVSRYRAKLKKPNLMPEQVDNYTKLLRQYEDEKVRLELKLKRQ